MAIESENTLTVFDVARNSYVDGPGVRTAVFVKGCNLRCAWCHNPESWRAAPELLFYPGKCAGCGECRRVCTTGADPGKCRACGECEIRCPADARHVAGRKMTVPELMKIIRRDVPFYRASGGGVTVSGGECMLNPEPLCELLSSCKREGISTAVDTAGCVPFSSFERVLPVTDVFLYDVKAITPDLHERYTGAGNAQILSNLKKLFALGAKVIIRVPVVKEVNGNREEMQKIADFLKPYRPEKVELLPYHRLGEGKYAALGRQPTCFTAPTEDEMREFYSLFG